MRKLLAALAVAASATLVAEDYKFIVDGWPAKNDSYSAASASTSLSTSTRRAKSASLGLEARFRTWDESEGRALRSDRLRGLVLILR